MSDLDTRILNGIDWLNDHGPANWWDRIDLRDLDLADPGKCVLGQVYAASADEAGIRDGYLYTQCFYGTGLLGLDPDEHTEWAEWLTECGFIPAGVLGSWADANDSLTFHWTLALQNLRREINA